MSNKPFAEWSFRAFSPRLFGRGGIKRAIFLPFGILLAAVFASSWWFHVRGSREALLAMVDDMARSGSSRGKSELIAFLNVPSTLVAVHALHYSEFGSLDKAPPMFARELAEFPALDILAVGLENGEYAEAQRTADGAIRLGRAGAQTGGALVFYSPEEPDARTVRDRKEGYDPRGRPWYRSALEADDVVWSEPYRYVSTGTAAVAAAKSIRDRRSGRSLGVVSATVGLASISSLLSSMKELSDCGAVAVIDGSGRVIAAAAAGTGPSASPKALSPVGDLPPPLDALFGGSSSLKSGLVYPVSVAGARWRVIGEPVRQGGLDWNIVLALPEARFLAPLEAAEHRVGAIYAAAYAAVLCIAFLIAHGISRPLRMLGAAATAFASQIGHRDDDPDQPHARDLSFIMGRKDELGRLATSFAELRARLTAVFKSLNDSISEKDVLLREVHHRVKNNLQIVSSLISLQEGEFDDPKYLNAMEILQDRVRSMAVVHETIYSSGNFSSVPMDDYLSRVTESLSAYRNSEVDLALSVVPGGVKLPLEQAIPCALIAVELATNAIKHAFADRSSGRVELCIRPDADSILLTVVDDGTGVSRDSADSGGTGSLIVAALASQLRGSYDIRAKEPGTSAEVRFPKPAF